MGFSIAVSAGEASGDLNGAFLVAELAKLRPDLGFWGAGGTRMRAAGVEIVVDMGGGGTIGILETFKSLPLVAAKYLRFRAELLRRKPDLFVPIDFGAFNLRLAQVLHKRGIPVVYYFPPSSWRKSPRNAAKLVAAGGKVITPFPWSAEFLASNGIDARFVGHPLVDIVKPTTNRADFLRELGLREDLPTIGLLPGSRGHELSEHLPPMIGCAEIMHRELGGAQFLMALAPQTVIPNNVVIPNGVRNLLSRSEGKQIPRAARNDLNARNDLSGVSGFPEIRVVQGRTYDCIAASDLLISKSGTATLEAAILGIPMIIVYRGSPIMRLEYRVRKHELEDYIGMPNIIADRGVCPELLNEDVTAEKMANIALSILRDEAMLNKMRKSLAEVRDTLGGNGAVSRAAHAVLEMAGL